MLNNIDLSRADLNLLVLFDAVFRERHVGRAAERLNLTASAVSHGLGRLRRLLNDPLFLRTPKGVVPSDRALELAAPIEDILARAGSVLAASEPFDPATSTRRFRIGAPDGVSAVFLPGLMARIAAAAPWIDVGVRQILPAPGELAPARAWRGAFADLEARAIDLAVLPTEEAPPRFVTRPLFQEEFVIAARRGHSFHRDPSVARYCEMRHLVVSDSGDPYGFVDEALAGQGYERRVVLTVPNFMFALAMTSQTDLICAMPRRLVELYGAAFDVVATPAPLPLRRFELNVIAPRVAMLEAGLAWLAETLQGVSQDR
jgi:DNA-binding transcriptional LysR family regulator